MEKSNKPTTVVLDVMGADAGPETIIDGGLQAVSEKSDLLKLVLVGKAEVINDCLSIPVVLIILCQRDVSGASEACLINTPQGKN